VIVVVSDTSPITSLAAIAQLDLLQQLYQQIVALLNGDMFLNVKPLVSRSKTYLESAIPKLSFRKLCMTRWLILVKLYQVQ
jgi:predicted nucleic acid-binding protein